jgi:phage shock protein A
VGGLSGSGARGPWPASGDAGAGSALWAEARAELADVAASKHLLALQAERARGRAASLEAQAREALGAGREDMARRLLTRRVALVAEAERLERQAAAVQRAQQDLERMVWRVARPTAGRGASPPSAPTGAGQAPPGAGPAAPPQGPAPAGSELPPEPTDDDVARVQERVLALRARAAALDELARRGRLGGDEDPLSVELARLRLQQRVDADLARLKAGDGSA